nr:uncharacterized protein LOC111427553 [Onthophagus taurus]
MEPTKSLPSGKIRKGLLTPCRTIGLSRKYLIETFKSPLIQENLVLSTESPKKETAVLVNPEEPTKPLPNVKIRKGLLTPCRTIGLSRKYLIDTFKSPLIQENLVLSTESPKKETAVLVNPQLSSTSVPSKHKGDNLSGKKAKKNKKTAESNANNGKTKLIEEELTKENSSYLNVLGRELLELDEIDENQTVIKKQELKSPLIQENLVLSTESPKKETAVLVNPQSSSTTVPSKCKGDNLSGNKTKKNKKIAKSNANNGKTKLIEEELTKENSSYLNVLGRELLKLDKIAENYTIVKRQELSELKVTLVRLPLDNQNLKKSENNNVVKCDEDQKVPKKSLNKKSGIIAKIVTPVKSSKSQITVTPKTLLVELETKPLLNSVTSTSETKSQLKSHTQRSIDLEKMNKKKKLAKNSSKLSLKKTMSDSFESDDEFLKEPKSTQSLKKAKPINKSGLIEKIIKLQKTVSEKESILERHKQAEIYRKLHNVNKLAELKSMWTHGCKIALQDLLVKLREIDPNFDMPKLLTRLKAPAGLLKYNEENCDFE